MHGIIVYGEPINRAALADMASFVGASQLDLYENGRLAASSSTSAARTLPRGAPVDSPYTSGSNTIVLTAVRNSTGRLQALLRVTVDSATVAVTRSALRRTAGYAGAAALIICLIVGLAVTRTLSRPLQRLASAAISSAPLRSCASHRSGWSSWAGIAL